MKYCLAASLHVNFDYNTNRTLTIPFIHVRYLILHNGLHVLFQIFSKICSFGNNIIALATFTSNKRPHWFD